MNARRRKRIFTKELDSFREWKCLLILVTREFDVPHFPDFANARDFCSSVDHEVEWEKEKERNRKQDMYSGR